MIVGVISKSGSIVPTECKPICQRKEHMLGNREKRQERRKFSTGLIILSLLLLSQRVEAGKQRESEEPTPAPPITNLPTEFPSLDPTPVPTGIPTAYPTPAPTTIPEAGPTLVPTRNEPTATIMPTKETKSSTTAPSTQQPTDYSEEYACTLEIPEMRLAFTMPPNTRLVPMSLQQDWQSFLTSVLQVAVGIKVEWTEWDPDVTYTTVSGNGVAQAVGQVAIDLGSRRRRLNGQVTQQILENELYNYFFVWGVDDMWEYFVAQDYPITSLNLRFSDSTFSPRRSAPEALAFMVAKEDDSRHNRNAWIAGVVMAAVVVIMISAVALLYLQRQGRHNSKASEAASPRTMAVSDPASPEAGGPRLYSNPEGQKSSQGSFDRNMDFFVRNNLIVTGAPSEDVSSVPGFSESSFLYDASRLDQVIDSARGYELPYAVPTNTFSDLTSDIKDLTQNDEEDEEDDIIEVSAPSSDDGNVAVEKEPSFQATSNLDIAYSRTIFNDEKKETSS